VEHPRNEENRLAKALDAVLHLLDRQVLDVDGRLVCKVDDVELTLFDDGVLGVTGLLSGPAALVPRLGDDGFGRRLHGFWRLLGTASADHDDPYRIDLELVGRLGSGVELSVPRAGVLLRQGQRGRRLNELLQMTVQTPDGQRLGRPIDVRIEPERTEPGNRMRVVGLVVGHGRPGSYFGYDRRPDMGPWLVNRVVRRLHRHSAYVALDDVEELDWDAGVVRVDPARLRDLEAAS
jgi:sporulation protein YlmC with PRC-barrel domain